MHLQRSLVGLPASLVLLVANQIDAQQLPTAIKKMSLDDGEKIMPDYLAFDPQFAAVAQSPVQARGLSPNEELLLALNSSAALPFRPPFGILQEEGGPYDGGERPALYRRAREALHRLQGRSFSCPDNTHGCDSIDQPNYCCSTGETCFTVKNSPNAGNVGCCPDGLTCNGGVGSCGGGSTSCPAEQGGGCCIPGYVCAQIGCIASSVSIITLTTTSSTVIAQPTPTTQVTTVVVTTTPSIITPTETETSTGTNTGGLPPYRPTSGTGSPTTDPPTAPSDYCPTGFYACLASAGAGCCRTGRDCVTTSCPPVRKTTVTSNGMTLVVPATDVPDAEPTSTCAGGWFLCPSEAGPIAGCCPSGYACGTASCTLSAATATATVQKEFPGSAANDKAGRGRRAFVFSVGTLAFGAFLF